MSGMYAFSPGLYDLIRSCYVRGKVRQNCLALKGVPGLPGFYGAY